MHIETRPYHCSLVFLLLTILPMFLGHIPPLTSYKFLALILFSVLAISIQLPTISNSLPDSIRSFDTFNYVQCHLKTHFPSSFNTA